MGIRRRGCCSSGMRILVLNLEGKGREGMCSAVIVHFRNVMSLWAALRIHRSSSPHIASHRILLHRRVSCFHLSSGVDEIRSTCRYGGANWSSLFSLAVLIPTTPLNEDAIFLLSPTHPHSLGPSSSPSGSIWPGTIH